MLKDEKKNLTMRVSENEAIMLEILRGINFNLEGFTMLMKSWVEGAINPGMYKDMLVKYINEKTEGKF